MDGQGNRRRRWARILLMAAAPLVAAGSSSGSDYHYRLRLSDDLDSVTVEVRLPDDSRPLSSRQGRADRLRNLTACDGRPVALRDGRIIPGGLGGCLRYRYPLEPQSGRRSPPAGEGVRVATPGSWLWIPVMQPGERLIIDVEADPDMAVSVPWRRIGERRYELGPSPGSATGTAVFGRFPNPALRVGGATLRVAALDGPGLELDREKIIDWLRVAARDVASVGGAFPNPDLQVIVQAVRSRGPSPVPFGYVIRDGGEAVRFFVDPARSLDDYHGDWTATHEFAHLLLPYVRNREKWVSEGFASYYQNVLLARRGVYTDREAWSRLVRSFSRADQVPDPPPLDRLHERAFKDVRMLVYWSGAAMALMADVRLREMSGGGRSLDTVLAELARCCLPSERVWTGQELFARLDALSPAPVFLPLYDAFMARRGMPDLAVLYDDLGILADSRGVTLRRQGRLAHVREAIMRPNRD